jgi:hypothetical protein
MTALAFDLREVKAEALKLLPPGNPVRIVIEAEPDLLQGQGAEERLLMLLRLVAAHRGRAATAS